MLSSIVLAAASPAFAQGFGFKWWQTERFKKELSLTTEQVTRIEGIYQTSEPLLRAQKQAIDRREEKLSKVIQDPKSDEPMLLQATDRLEAARNELSRTRTLMLFRIRRVLTDEQNLKITEMHAKDRAEREKAERERKNNNKGPGGDDHDHSDCQ
ncbi:MAG TPA: periplasmic heavy metal sensor [Vicinamibacterales bacterium]|nr:periplasmic heavy metal sensor [Vicinamibacterales bacterium]